MKLFKKILFGIFCVVDLYFLYSTIGYLVLGIQTPNILGDRPTTFTGMYIMSLTFFLLTIVLTTILVVILVKYVKNKK